jgi:hypothetical protein
MSLGNRYITALSKRYEAEMAEAEANLALYLSNNNLAAIGEHSDLMAVCIRHILPHRYFGSINDLLSFFIIKNDFLDLFFHIVSNIISLFK